MQILLKGELMRFNHVGMWVTLPFTPFNKGSLSFQLPVHRKRSGTHNWTGTLAGPIIDPSQLFTGGGPLFLAPCP